MGYTIDMAIEIEVNGLVEEEILLKVDDSVSFRAINKIIRFTVLLHINLLVTLKVSFFA